VHNKLLFLYLPELWSVAKTKTESQNHRIVGVGRDLCGSPSPTPCPSRVTHSRLHRTLSKRVLNISREGDSTTTTQDQKTEVNIVHRMLFQLLLYMLKK